MSLTVQQKIDMCKESLREYNISQDIIESCFIPDETESDIEIKGSLISALITSNFDSSFYVCASEGNKIYSKLFGCDIPPYEITDFTKKNNVYVKDITDE